MRRMLLFVVLAIGLLAEALAAQQQPVSRYIKAYSGGEGFVVWVLRYGPRENAEALVQVNGIDHKLDGKILHTKMESSSGGLKYVATVDGRQLDILYVDSKGVELRLTGAPWTSTLCYDKALSEKGSAEVFRNEFLEQK